MLSCSIDYEYLDRAIRQNRFYLCFQPIYDLKTNKYPKAEVLLRLKGEDGEVIKPCHFISLAEKSGKILQIGYRVIKEVCLMINKYNLKDKILKINISPIQLENERFAQSLERILAHYNISKENVVFELTSHFDIPITDELIDAVMKLKALQIKFSLDDICKADWDFTKIIKLQAKEISIDKNCMSKVVFNEKERLVIANLALFANSQNIEITLEGIQNSIQYKTALELHCRYLQGDYFSVPITEKEYIAFINAR